jgi:DUF1365 family protein
MGVDAQLFFGRVMHGRLFPKKNNFTYGIYYLALPLSKLAKIPIAHNTFAPLSFYDRDHGDCDGSNLEHWARKTLLEYGLSKANGEITLLCMPRVFGYVFNPVSFWLCHDKQGDLRAVLCEVHNTFGERHTYLCAHEDQRVIEHSDVLSGEKLFHVSPLLKREGRYTFRFDVRDGKYGVSIDFYDADDKKQLVTTLMGDFEPMNKQTLRTAFWRYPLVTVKAIILIHWQAAKLLSKGIKYIARPQQKDQKTSGTDKITKM